MTRGFSFLILLLSFATTAQAFIVAQWGNATLDPKKPTHIVVAGRGAELGYLFAKAATVQIKKYADLYPNDQLLLITVSEKDPQTDPVKIKSWGYSRVDTVDGLLTADQFFNQINSLTAIASLNFFTHTSAQIGINLDGSTVRLDEKHSGWKTLATKMLPGSYAFFHGCNSGFMLAPAISEILKVPAMGSLAATGFQYLLDQQVFYRYDSTTPPVGAWATNNLVSFSSARPCENNCLRMQSDSFPYDGVWGKYMEGGLSFYKTFCRGVPGESCLRGMAQSLKAFPSTTDLVGAITLEQYKEVVVDFLCPFKLKSDVRGDCIKGLNGTDRYFNSFEGKALQCDFNGCQYKMQCDVDKKGTPIAGTCKIQNLATKSTSLKDEYDNYLAAYPYLMDRKLP